MEFALMVEKVEKLVSRFRHGGARPGSGRPPKPKNPTILERAYGLLDESTLPAIQCVVDLLTDPSPSVRLRAAELILAKTIPDQSHTDHGGLSIVNVVYGYRSSAGDLRPRSNDGAGGSTPPH